MLIEELAVPHDFYVVENPGKEAWFGQVNPCRMIPALEDFMDDLNARRTAVWESSSCLTFLADKYDQDGLFSGKDLFERTEVGNWMALHTASLG